MTGTVHVSYSTLDDCFVRYVNVLSLSKNCTFFMIELPWSSLLLIFCPSTKHINLTSVVLCFVAYCCRCSMESSCIGIAQEVHKDECYVIVPSGDLETFSADCKMHLWNTSYLYDGKNYSV